VTFRGRLDGPGPAGVSDTWLPELSVERVPDERGRGVRGPVVQSPSGGANPMSRNAGLAGAVGGARTRNRPRRVFASAARHPFLGLAMIAVLFRFGLPAAFPEGFSSGATGGVWHLATWFLWPFSLLATWIDPYLMAVPEWVEAAATLALGLIPYLVLDAVYRRVRRRRGTGPARQR
jgi:hypothetical protein